MIDPATAGIAFGVLGTVVGVLGKTYSTKRAHDSRHDDVLVRIIDTEQSAHKETRERLSQATVELELRAGQVGDIGARLETLGERFDELREDFDNLKTANQDCEKRAAELVTRVYRLERRSTPPRDTPAVVGRPIQHETVGDPYADSR